MASAILKKLWVTHRRDQAKRRQARSRRQGSKTSDPHPSFLSLPAEIRLNIYSYMISPSSASRSLRATCHYIKEEIDYEDREAFSRGITASLHINWKDIVHIKLLANTTYHHVNAVVELPQPLSLTVRVQLHTVAVLYNEMRHILQNLPLNTRSVTIVVKPYAQCTGLNFDIFYCSFARKLYSYFAALHGDARAGATDLCTLEVMAADPIVLSLEIPYRRSAWKRLTGFEVKGLCFEYKRKGRGRVVKVSCQAIKRYSRLSREWVWYKYGKGDFRLRYQPGCVD
ncbi:hypothetical protein G6514_007815 [Epicoccum nigrum]|nr:hypothetical protein G6514_007815 [Epicoccum nigrum]